MLNKCFGIISWFPDKEPARTQRQNRINRLFTQLNNLWPDIDILVVAQNWGNFKPVETTNNQIIKNYMPLGILGARKTLREEFLKSNYNYIIMFDDDAIIECDNETVNNDFIIAIENNPNGFCFVKGEDNAYNPYAGAQLNLCAISRFIYNQEPMVDIDPQKGEGFEDCIFATLLHHKYADYEFNIPEGIRCIQFRNPDEPVESTWWGTHKNGKYLIQNTNFLCRYIAEHKRLPNDYKKFLSSVEKDKAERQYERRADGSRADAYLYF